VTEERTVTLPAKLDLSPEERLLLICARLDLSQAQRNELDSLVGASLRWEKVLYRAQWHGLTGLVFHHLKSLGNWQLVPPEVRDQLRAAYLANGAKTSRSELTQVLAALEERDIPVISLKGAALSEEVYRDICLRPMADLDLLVPEEKAHVAQGIVQGLGYHQVGTTEEQEDTTRHHRHLPGLAHNGKPVLVEIHRHVVRRDSGLHFDIEGLWERARSAEVAGRPALVLAPQDQVIHLCLNFFVDRGFRSQTALRQLCDVAESIRCYDSPFFWDQLTDQVEEYNLAGPVSCVLYAAQRLLEAPVPQKVVQQLWPAGFEEASVRSYLRRRVLDARPWVARSLARPGSEYRWSDVAASELGHLVPKRQYMARRRHRANTGISVSQLYLARIWQGVGILFRAAMRPGEMKEDLSIDRWIHSLLPARGELS
jgi:hypothetical protein